MRHLTLLLVALGLGACGFEPGDHLAGGGGPGGSGEDAASVVEDAQPGTPAGPDGEPGGPDAGAIPSPDVAPVRVPDAEVLDCEEDRDCPRDHRCRDSVCEYDRGGGGGGPGSGD